MNYENTLQYLYEQLPMYQRIGPMAYKKDLTNTLALADFLGHPELKYPTLHVAGTNGKGSVTHLLAAALQAQGKKVGVYTSPHYKDFRERIKINGTYISKEFVTWFVEHTRSISDQIEPSFFELSSMMAFQYFAHEKVDIAVIEVGLGGRLDSTNIISPLLSVITNISLDHTALLGETLPLIATEKAGIIKSKTPVVIGEYLENTKPVFEKKAAEMDAEIFFTQQTLSVEISSSSTTHTTFEVFENNFLKYNNLIVNINGDYQSKNIATALQAIGIYNELPNVEKISEQHIRDGFFDLKKTTNFLGRWQILGTHPTVIADSAHNEAGLKLAIQQLKTLPYRELHIVLGFVNDKDVSKMLALFPTSAKYYFAKADIPRGLDAEVLKNEAGTKHLIGENYATVKDALLAAQKNAADNDLIYVGGSCFVVAEVI